MPVGDVTINGQAWHQVFADNFSTENIGLGGSCGSTTGFPHALTAWNAYPWPWKGTPTWANYCPERTTSIQNGLMDIYLHSEVINGTTTYLIDAPEPGNPYVAQTYGRYVVRFKADTFHGYHASWLLWPTSGIWPGDGEIDFPEADTNGNISAFMHWQGGTSGGSQDAYSTNVPMGGDVWHTAEIDWLPSRVTFILDGNVIGNSTNTSHIPNTPMRFVIQNGGSFGSAATPSDSGHIYIDWVTIYSKAS